MTLAVLALRTVERRLRGSGPPPAPRKDLRHAGTGTGVGEEPEPSSLTVLLNSVALILAKAASMGLGFLFWVLAARLFAPTEVGIAAGAVSAIMLCTQIALLGIGSAVIFRFLQHSARPATLLNTAFTIVVLTALGAGGLSLAVASLFLDELGVVASEPLYAFAFLAMSVLGTVEILFDQISTVLRRGYHVLVRAAAMGGVAITLAAVFAIVMNASSSLAIFSAWVLGGLTASLLAAIQLWRSLARYQYRPRVEVAVAKDLFRVGLPNHALTLTERAPGLLLPILVIELISPEANAYWYVVWMMSWVVFIVPIQVGINVFAEAARRPQGLPRLVRHGIRSSLAFGATAAVALALGAHAFLSLLGEGYADAGATPLRILVLALVPLTFVQAYYAVCRATATLREAIATGVASAVVGVSATAAAGLAYGLTGMAVAWVATQALTGIWAAFRLRVRTRDAAVREEDELRRRAVAVSLSGGSGTSA